MDVQSLESHALVLTSIGSASEHLPLGVPCLRRVRGVFEQIRSRKFGVFHQAQHMHPHLQP